jgi:hypothetical protein
MPGACWIWTDQGRSPQIGKGFWSCQLAAQLLRDGLVDFDCHGQGVPAFLPGHLDGMFTLDRLDDGQQLIGVVVRISILVLFRNDPGFGSGDGRAGGDDVFPRGAIG